MGPANTVARCLLSLALLAAPAGAADRIESVEDAYAARHLRHTPFDPRADPGLGPEDGRFLSDLFTLTDEVVLLNADVARWFATEGAAGLHPEVHLERVGALRSRLARVQTPKRVVSVRDLVAESLALQHAFIGEWHEALAAGRSFPSQLTDEFAYHEGLHRSHRMLLQAFAELNALFPDAGETTHLAFRDHLRAMDFR